MKFIEAQKINGFTVARARRLEELGGELYELNHDKTGARLCWFNDGDKNKMFSVAFKTVPEDSTGVFHILEHTLLNGSDKYPVKEPFVELLKGSLNTFLNAFTFQDKTMYPVSSCNEADFMNLTDVYLDAVFHPLIGKNQNIFRQEGWHVELESETAEPCFKGVVYNEMKGATSSQGSAISRGVNALLYPDSPYRFVSGGDPKEITNLTYEKYLETYKKFYHPSNARFWLDGDMPIEKVLGLIDGYLSTYERNEDMPFIPAQKPFSGKQSKVCYELNENEPIENHTQLVFARLISDWKQHERNRALSILAEVLSDSNEAPFTRAILEKGLGQDVSVSVDDGNMQTVLRVTVKNTEAANEDKVRETLRGVIDELIKNGLDKNELEAVLNKQEFQVKQPEEPQGLIRAISALSAWLHGGDPAEGLLVDEVFAFLRKQLETDYFEKLLGEAFDFNAFNTLHVLPSHTFGEERRQEEKERLDAITSAWTDEDKKTAADITRKLVAWQQTPDSEEALATIPKLPLSEINPEPELIPTAIGSAAGVTVLNHKMNCKGVIHVSLYFNLNGSDYEAVTLLPMLLGSLPTRRHDVRSLNREIKRVIGEFKASVSVTAPKNQTEYCADRLEVHFSVLENKLKEAEELIYEMLTETCFDAHDKIRELVMQDDDSLRRFMVMGGHMLSVIRTSAHYSALAALTEVQGGLTRIKWMHELAQNFDAKIDAVAETLAKCLNECICRARLTAAVCASGDVDLTDFIESFKQGTAVPENIRFALDLPLREGVVIPAQICYAGCAVANPLTERGSFSVLRTLINYSYLWNEVRVKGGAYGSGMAGVAPLTQAMYSYRDPSAVNTLKAYRSMADWLKEFIASGASLDNSVISAIGEKDGLATVQDRSYGADKCYFASVTDEDLRLSRKELIETTAESLKRFVPVFENIKDGAVCVVGSRTIIDECKDEDLVIMEV